MPWSYKHRPERAKLQIELARESGAERERNESERGIYTEP